MPSGFMGRLKAIRQSGIDWSNREAVHRAVASHWESLKYASRQLTGDRDFILEGMKGSWKAMSFQHVNPDLKEDHDFIRSVVQYNPQALTFASMTIRSDRAFVEDLALRNPRVVQYASKELQSKMRTRTMCQPADCQPAAEEEAPKRKSPPKRSDSLPSVHEHAWDGQALKRARSTARSCHEVPHGP